MHGLDCLMYSHDCPMGGVLAGGREPGGAAAGEGPGTPVAFWP